MRLEDGQWEEIDENTWRLHIEHLYEIDRFQLLGPGNVKMHLDLETIYTRKPGKPIIITPQSTDPTDPSNWAGTVWQGFASSRFSARNDDGSWSVKGTADWAQSLPVEGAIGHIMHERNGVFAHQRGHDRASGDPSSESRLQNPP